jgi:hypothetical protein
MSKIHCILLTKNEEDIIELCLRESSKWAHRIYVYDGASVDGTWEKVQAMAGDVIVPWRSEDRVFQEHLRRDVFEAFKAEVRPGDWWLQLNADEFYVEDPSSFLDRVDRASQVVWGNSIEYYLTDVDVQNLDFGRPVADVLAALKYYRIFNSERRFFRHRARLPWQAGVGWPRHLGVVEPMRIAFRHYPYRSPRQIQTRLDRRRESKALGFAGGDHDNFLTWQEKIVDHKTLSFDQGDAVGAVGRAQLPRHVPAWWHDRVQRLFHGIGIWP